MRLMLDTHVLLWWRDDSTRLSHKARSEIANANNEIVVSIASLWEISIKRGVGKLRFADDLETVLREEQFSLLPISFEHLRELEKLPPVHRDPFDRVIISQSLNEHIPIITSDRAFAAYGPALIW